MPQLILPLVQIFLSSIGNYMLCSNFGTWFSDATNDDRSDMSWCKDVTGDQKVSSWWGSRSVLLTERCPGELIKKAEMGGSRGTYGGKENAYNVSVRKS